jgi:hypothetical protein
MQIAYYTFPGSFSELVLHLFFLSYLHFLNLLNEMIFEFYVKKNFLKTLSMIDKVGG